MKSVMFNAEGRMDPSYQEGNETVYKLELCFDDVFGTKRKHMTIFATDERNLTHRISFTALSHVEMQLALVTKVTDLEIEVVTQSGSKTVQNCHDHHFCVGDPVALLEHMMLHEDPATLDTILIPRIPDVEFDVLRIQAVNLDVINDKGDVVFRLGADPLRKRMSYDKRMAT